jgi:hypothetical protein
LKFNILFYPLLVLTFGACQKTQNYYEFDLSIQDQNENTVSGALVKAFIKPAGANGLGAFETSGTATTDADGTVNFKIDKQSAFSFRFDIVNSGYYDASHTILADEVPVTSPYQSELLMDSKGWFRINVTNTSGAVAVFYNILADAPNGEDCCEQSQQVFTGVAVNESFICSMYGDQNFNLDGKFTDVDGLVTFFNHSLHVAQGDTLVFDLDY